MRSFENLMLHKSFLRNKIVFNDKKVLYVGGKLRTIGGLLI